MRFKEFASNLEKIEKASGRIVMTDYLVEILKSLERDEIKPAMYLLLGRVVPKFVSLEFNMARKLIIRAIADAFKKDVLQVEKKFKKVGDLGLLAETFNKKKSSNLNIVNVYHKLYHIALLKGEGSQNDKVKGVSDLMNDSDSVSSRYIVRIVLGNLRLGLSDKSVLDALSILSVGDKSKRELLDKAYGNRSDIGYIAEKVISEGVDKLEEIEITTGIPVASMLCERESTEKKIFERSKDWLVQPKYDGLRCQVHYDKKCFKIIEKGNSQQFKFVGKKSEDTRIFSRNQENLTNMFPDIREAVKELGIDSLIIDGEAIGYDTDSGISISFQQTIQRRRKYDVKKLSQQVPIKLFAFDLLFINGEDISDIPLKDRIRRLKRLLAEQTVKDTIQFTATTKVASQQLLASLFKEYVDEGMEGVVFKLPESKYEPGKRGFSWIKFKKSSKGYLVDSIDAVVLGYYRGRGARAKFGIGAILVGVYNKKKERFESIAKVGTGIKDKDWKTIKIKLDGLLMKRKPENVKVKKELEPDIWVRPEVVVVIDADEVTRSTNHTAGLKKGRGYSLRFPRLVEFDRKDKAPYDITSVSEIEVL